MLRRLALPSSSRQTKHQHEHLARSLAHIQPPTRHAHHLRFHPNAAKKKRTARPVAAWKVREKELRSELAALEAQADELRKKTKAEEATAGLPELDDASLDEIYEGVKEIDPIPASDLKLLEDYEEKTKERYSRILQKTRKLLPLPSQEEPAPLTFAERMTARLIALSSRLEKMQKSALVEGAPSSSATAGEFSELQEIASELKQSLEALNTPTEADDPVPERAEESESSGNAPADLDTFETVHLHNIPEQAAQPVSKNTMVSDVSTSQTSLSFSEEDLLKKLDSLLEVVSGSGTDENTMASSIHPDEWKALGIISAQRRDFKFLARAFETIERLTQNEVVEKSTAQIFYDSVLDTLAGQGDASRCEHVVHRMVLSGLSMTAYTTHALVKSYLRSPDGRLSQALSLLNRLEESTTPASEATYSMTISHLLNSPHAQVRDEAWGVWYRMRLNAYPVPDAVLWGSMIRACAHGVSPVRDSGISFVEPYRKSKQGPSLRELRGQTHSHSEKEAAVDLFREMTVVHGIRPLPTCYIHLIMACCKSPDEGAYLDGFKFLSEMITLAKESKIQSYEPERATFGALLEGCKRNRDLLRARWVLAEMIRSSAPLWSSLASSQQLSWKERVTLMARMPDAYVLNKLFFTYAAWSPASVPMKGKATEATQPEDGTEAAQVNASEPDVDPNQSSSGDQEQLSPSTSTSSTYLSQVDVDEAATEFSSRPPATSAEAIREIRGLLARIIADQVGPDSLPRGPFSSVQLSSRLVDSYLSALIAHAPPKEKAAFVSSTIRPDETQDQMKPSLYGNLGLPVTGHTLLLASQACFASDTSPATVSLADWTWEQWRTLERSAIERGSMSTDEGTDRRTRERIWAERIKFLCKADELDAAMSTLREFVQLYPPTPKPATPPEERRKMPYFDFPAILRTMQSIDQEGHAGPPRLERSVPSKPPSEDGQVDDAVTSTAGKPEEEQSHAATVTSSAPAGRSTTSVGRPPTLRFFDLNLLHQRLLEANRSKDVAYVGWVCKVGQKVESVKWLRRKERRSEAERTAKDTVGGNAEVETVVVVEEEESEGKGEGEMGTGVEDGEKMVERMSAST